jgi:hypothetical protein
MPRFHFNLRAHETYLLDEEGEDCPTLQAAGNRALAGATELLHELRPSRQLINEAAFEITDESGELKLRIPFTLAASQSVAS